MGPAIMAGDWFDYTTEEGGDYIPIERWGQDHYSTLAYLETCAVDHDGLISNARMRCNARRHRPFAYMLPVTNTLADGSKYPTRLKDGERQDHDDWDILDDLLAAGLVTAQWHVKYPDKAFGHCEARVAFTERGFEIAAQLRKHKAHDGKYATFIPFKEIPNAE